jgi:uncharacterized membrane protein YqiK
MPEFTADPVIAGLTPVRASLQSFAAGLVIKNDLTYRTAAERLKIIKGALAQIEDARTRITKPINESLRETNAQAKAAAAPFLTDEQLIKIAMVRYSDEQDRIREEAQRRANAIADAERRRLQAIADEATRKANEDAAAKRREAEVAADAGRQAEADRLRASAARVEERAADKAEQFESRAAQVVAPVSQAAAPKVSGVTTRDVWKFEVVDQTKINAAFLMPDDVKIRKLVLSMKGDAVSVVGAGIRVWVEKQLASASA